MQVWDIFLQQKETKFLKGPGWSPIHMAAAEPESHCSPEYFGTGIAALIMGLGPGYGTQAIPN